MTQDAGSKGSLFAEQQRCMFVSDGSDPEEHEDEGGKTGGAPR